MAKIGQSLNDVLDELDSKAANAAARCKPLMWAYFVTVRERMVAEFGGVGVDTGAEAGCALAISQQVEDRVVHLRPMEAAIEWAVGVYARRVLTHWSGRKELVSLEWLRAREFRRRRTRILEKGQSALSLGSGVWPITNAK